MSLLAAQTALMRSPYLASQVCMIGKGRPVPVRRLLREEADIRMPGQYLLDASKPLLRRIGVEPPCSVTMPPWPPMAATRRSEAATPTSSLLTATWAIH